MECKKAQQLVKPYIDGKIEDKELAQFIAHIGTCKECYEELEINYTIFSALLQLDDKPDMSYNISAMLHEELNGSSRYIRRKRRVALLRISAMIALVVLVLGVTAMKLNLI